MIITACLAIIGERGLTVWGEGMLRTNANMVYLVWGVPLFQIAYSTGVLITDHNLMPQGLLNWIDTTAHRLKQKLEPLRQRLLGVRLVTEEA